MAVQVAALTVGTTPTEITAALNYGSTSSQRLILKNTGAADVFLGPSAVAVTVGFPLSAGATLQLDLDSDERLYAIAAAPVTVRVLRSDV